VLIVVRLVMQWRSQLLMTQQFVLWLIIWGMAVLLIAEPEISSYIALRVGITRGVDLVVYSSVIVIFYMLFKMLMRLDRQEKHITTLVQKIALDNIKKPDAKE
jgi:hypothetical protein